MMKNVCALFAFMFLLMIFPAGHVEGSGNPSLSQAKAAWVIEMSRDGGMRPRKEWVSITSEGDITVTSEHLSQGKKVLDCTRKEKLSAEDLRKLREAVRAARVREWKEIYEDAEHPPCCDQPTIRLSFQQRGAGGAKRSYSTSWYPGSSELRPADLVKTVEVVQELWNGARERCTE